MATVMNASLIGVNGASLPQRVSAERSTASRALRVRCMAEVSSIVAISVCTFMFMLLFLFICCCFYFINIYLRLVFACGSIAKGVKAIASCPS